jgi:hypothetical protein
LQVRRLAKDAHTLARQVNLRELRKYARRVDNLFDSRAGNYPYYDHFLA